MSSIFSRIKKIFTFPDAPSFEMSPERVEEITDKIAFLVSKYDLEVPVLFLTKPLVPTSTIISQTIIAPLAPMIESLGIKGYELAAFLDDKENLKSLVSKIEEIKINKENTM
jgi:hypothetical protein